MRERDVWILLAVLLGAGCTLQLLGPGERRMGEPWTDPFDPEPIRDRDPGDEKPAHLPGVECPRCCGERVSAPDPLGRAWCRVCDRAVQLLPSKAA